MDFLDLYYDKKKKKKKPLDTETKKKRRVNYKDSPEGYNLILHYFIPFGGKKIIFMEPVGKLLIGFQSARFSLL